MAGGMFDQRRMKTLDHAGSATVLGEPLPTDLVLTDAALSASCTAEGAFDLHAVLVEEHACGAVINISDGITRSSGPGKVTVDLAPTFYRASHGNRLGLILAASTFPRVDRATQQLQDLRLRDTSLSFSTVR